ncbi:MAG: HEAT repeat domain-containing protein [Planctomycetota bacterium]|jgi:hypothetical protein
MSVLRRISPLSLLLLLCACASGPEETDPDRRLEADRLAWEHRTQESDRMAAERAGVLPDELEAFASDDISRWRQAKATLDLLEKKQKGFVYARILVLLPRAMKRGSEGEPARKELVQIGRIIREARRLESPEPSEWTEARIALQRLGSQGVDAAAVRLIVKLRNHDPNVLSRVQDELAALGSGAVRHLALALQSERIGQFIKDRCVDVLARIGAPAVPALSALLEEGTDRGGRFYAAKALGKLGDPALTPGLAAAEAREADPYVRCALLDALTRLGGQEAEKAAIRGLGAADLSVVKFSARAVAKLGASGAVQALIDALERTGREGADDVRVEVLGALRLLTGRPGGTDPAWWRERFPK